MTETSEDLLEILDEAGCDEAMLVASLFVKALILEPDLFAAWHLVDTDSRRVATGAFVDAVVAKEHLTPDQATRVADELAALGPEHTLWERFARAALASWQAIFAPVDFTRWAYCTRARPIALDVEVVFLADVGEQATSGRADPREPSRRSRS